MLAGAAAGSRLCVCACARAGRYDERDIDVGLVRHNDLMT
jgi:hypothetical protein